MKPHIVFTGGGTAGHVVPNLALMDALDKEGWKISYLGSKDGVEATMVKGLSIPYHAVSSGKLRRYFSWQNALTPLAVLWGIGQAYFLLRSLKADVLFSKGGFVAFPVVVAAWLNRLPIVAHESDRSPGLANRLSFPFANMICVTFAEAKQAFKYPKKVKVTGTPLRASLSQGKAEKARFLCGFTSTKPCVLVMGGSQGSLLLNKTIRQNLTDLTQRYQVIHLCGHGKVDKAFEGRPDYCQFEYADETLPDLLALSAFVISRAGANTVYELLALAKPHLLIPLSNKASRGEQVENATYFKALGVSEVLEEEALTRETFLAALEKLVQDEEVLRKKMKTLGIHSATQGVIDVIKEQLKC